MNMKTNICEITDYIEKTLAKWGFEVYRSCSAVSGSEYLAFGSDGETKKIRVSDHNLPSTYEGRNGMPFDFDVYSKSRAFAINYVDFLDMVAKKHGFKLPAHVKNEVAKKEEALKAKKEIQNFLQDKQETITSFEKDMFSWAEKNLPDLTTERKEIIKEMAITPKKQKQNLRKKRIALEMEIGLNFRLHLSKRIRTTLSWHTINLSNDVRITKQIKKRVPQIRYLYSRRNWLW